MRLAGAAARHRASANCLSVVLLAVLRHRVEKTGQALCGGHCPIDIGNQPLAVLRIAAGKVEEIGNMIGAEDGFRRCQVTEHLPRLVHQFAPAALLQRTDKIVVMAVKEGQQREKLRIDPVDPGRRPPGMLQAAPPAGKPEDGGHRQLHPRLSGLERQLCHPRRR